MNIDYYCECCRTKMKRVYPNMTKHLDGVEFYRCADCKLVWAPELTIDTAFRSKLNEKNRVRALEAVRHREFGMLKNIIDKHIKKGNGLEVGCAYGWFMEMLRDGYQVEGIEAEREIAQRARDKGLKVYIGLFPEDMDQEKRYDFIVFNNVWEHINHVNQLIESCLNMLREGGYLLITVPLSTGGIYKCAELLEKIGRTKELERLWQAHFHSPHIYFYSKENLEKIMLKHSFELIDYCELSSIDIKTIKDRFGMDYEEKHAALKGVAFQILWPILRLLPKDKAIFIFKRS